MNLIYTKMNINFSKINKGGLILKKQLWYPRRNHITKVLMLGFMNENSKINRKNGGRFTFLARTKDRIFKRRIF